MGGDPRSNDSLFHIVEIRQPQMLGRRHIAKEVGAICRSDRSADCAGNVVIAGGHVGDERSEHIKRRAMTQPLLHHHIAGNFIDRHMSRSFNHHLHIASPGAFGQFAERDQFLDLRGVGRIMNRAGPAGVTQAERHVIFHTDIQQSVVVFIKWIFLAVHLHPGKQ